MGAVPSTAACRIAAVLSSALLDPPEGPRSARHRAGGAAHIDQDVRVGRARLARMPAGPVRVEVGEAHGRPAPPNTPVGALSAVATRPAPRGRVPQATPATLGAERPTTWRASLSKHAPIRGMAAVLVEAMCMLCGGVDVPRPGWEEVLMSARAHHFAHWSIAIHDPESLTC